MIKQPNRLIGCDQKVKGYKLGRESFLFTSIPINLGVKEKLSHRYKQVAKQTDRLQPKGNRQNAESRTGLLDFNTSNRLGG